VRFLSLWENRMESRGHLYASAGDVHLWDTSSLGSIVEAEIQMHISIHVHLKPHVDWILSGRRPNEIELWDYRFFTGFVGRTREESSAVLLLILESKRARRRISTVMKRLDWLGYSSRFLVITAAPSVFGQKEFDEQWSRNRRAGGRWSEIETEVRRRMKTLSYNPD
jgi:hypothetical protein